ncbi:MAG: pyridoxal phosphate-dependent aminotransferase [Ignavibacteria bacterium]
MIADRINRLTESKTMKIAGKALAMKARGEDIIDFSVGEPDFPTPERIKQAAKKAIDNNFTCYTVNMGMIELRQAVSEKLKRDNNLDYSVKEIIISNGAKQALFNIVFAVVNPGDEVLIPAPFYVSYPEMVKLADGTPVIINTREENNFKLTADDLKRAVTPKTKALILCNPSNPTGLVYTGEELKALADVIENEDIFVIVDEIYEKLVYDNIKFVSFASISEKIKAKTAIINGVSKAYAMTGWRIGYAAAPEAVIRAASTIQSHNTSGASSVSQMASLEAISGIQDEVRIMVMEFERRRDYIIGALNEIPSLNCTKSQGAFYAFVNVASYFGVEYNGRKIENSCDFADFIIEVAKVAIVPGEGFGSDEHIRISYSTSMENIVEGLRRINDALRETTQFLTKKHFL